MASALHEASAIRGGRAAVEALLKNADVDVNSCDAAGRAALHHAVLGDAEDIVALLLEAGASVNIKAKNGLTPLHCAVLKGNLQIATILLDNGADVMLAGTDMQTVMHTAASKGHDSIVGLLLERGARVDVENADKETPMEAAAKAGQLSVVQLLLSNERAKEMMAQSKMREDQKLPLCDAAYTGHKHVVEFLLEYGVSIHSTNVNGNTALHCAAYGGHTAIVELLLQKGSPVDVVRKVEDGFDACTPLQMTSGMGHIDTVASLLANGANVNAVMTDGRTALQIAAQYGHPELVRVLLDHGADIEAVNGDGATALHQAVTADQVEAVRVLLASGARVNTPDKAGASPLHTAVANGNMEVTELLLDNQADTTARESGCTPLHQAASSGQTNIVRLLLNYDADVGAVDEEHGRTALHIAALENHIDSARLLLEHRADTSAIENDGSMAIHDAAEKRHADFVDLLLEFGADINALAEGGYTALHWGVAHPDVIKVLLRRGADTSIQCSLAGNNALLSAADEGHAESVALLISHGMDLEATNDTGQTALIVAAYAGMSDVVSLLLDRGANLEAADADGSTALHSAALKGHEETVAVLLDRGADLSAQEKDLDTPLHCAASQGYEDLVKLLVDRGADAQALNARGQTPAQSALSAGHRSIAVLLGLEITNAETAVVTGNDAVEEAGEDDGEWEDVEYDSLHSAAVDGDVEAVRDMLDTEELDVNELNEDSDTALHCAASNGHCEVVALLLEYGANVSVKGDDEETALFAAATQGHLEVLRLLLDSGGSLTDVNTNGFTVLHRTAAENQAETTRLLLVRGASLHAVSTEKLTPLHCAAHNGATEAATLLLDRGADIHAVDADGYSPLHSAASDGHTETVCLLLDRGADYAARDTIGDTPLHTAARFGHKDTVELLLDRGAEMAAEGENGNTAVHSAASEGQTATVTFLLDHDADLTAINKAGSTPLHVSTGHSETLAVLLDRGADIAATEARGQSALHIAAVAGHVESTKLLLQRGAPMEATELHGRTSLHLAALARQDQAIAVLLDKGATANARDDTDLTPLDLVIAVQQEETTQLHDVLPTVRAMALRGAKVTVDKVHSTTKKPWRLGLAACASHWGGEYDAGLATLTVVPQEIIKRGADSVATYLDDMRHTSQRQMLYRRKICVVGPSEWGKTSLVASIAAQKASLTHIDNRTIGIDLETCSFVQQEQTHEVTFWDFAGQDVYQVAHALFFSPRTLYVVCVNVEAYARQLKAVAAMPPLAAEAAMASFVGRHILRWIQLIFTRQPDAQFVVVGTKADRVPSAKTLAEIWQDLHVRLADWAAQAKQDIAASFASTGRVTASFQEAMDALVAQVDGVVPRQWLVVSSASLQAVRKARESIQDVVVGQGDSFPMPVKYQRVLQFIQRRRRVAREMPRVQDRIEHSIVPVAALFAWLAREIDGLQPSECTAILQTLHDLGDVLWYERESSGFFKSVVVIDPTLVLEFVRHVVNHELQSSDDGDEEGCLRHGTLAQRPFWCHADPELVLAFKGLLQQFQLAYPADGGGLDWDADLIVPVYWKARRGSASNTASGSTSSSMDELARVKGVVWTTQFTWEYELPEDVSETVFDQFAVQSYSTLVQRTVWADCIESWRAGEFVARVALHDGPRRRHQVLRVDVAGAGSATAAWHSMRFFLMALESVLDSYPGLCVSRYIVDGASKRHRLGDALRAVEDAEAMGRAVATLHKAMPWLPPSLQWYMEKAWRDPATLREIQLREDVAAAVDKAEVLKKLVAQGDSKRRLPSLWTLTRTDAATVAVRMLSDLSGECFHDAIEIAVPAAVFAKHGAMIEAGVWICSNVVPDYLTLGVFNKALEMATSALSNQVGQATAVYSLIDKFDGSSSTSHRLSPRGSVALLRDLLLLHEPALDELRISDLARLECAATVDGCYVWASRQEIVAMGDALTPCDRDDFRFQDVATVDEAKPQAPEQQRGEADPQTQTQTQRTIRLTIVGTKDLPAWDWRRTYCKWELRHASASQPIVEGRTGYHTQEHSEPAWGAVGFTLPGVHSLGTLRECTLHVRLQRPSRWLGMVKLVGEGSIALSDSLPTVDGQAFSSRVHVPLDDKRVVVCEVSSA